MKRQSYHTSVKILYQLRCEQSIPVGLRSGIPRSNVHRWRTEQPGKYLGSELDQFAGVKLELLQQFSRHRSAQVVFRSWLRVVVLLRSICFSIPSIRRHIRVHLGRIVETVEQVRDRIGLAPVLKALKLSSATYHEWRARHLARCLGSAQSLCLRRHPQQATFGEVSRLRDWLTDPDYLHWPISSVAAFARRAGEVLLSNQSVYRYAKVLGIRREPRRKERKEVSVRASRPGEIIHCDVTVFRTGDGVKQFVYLAIDNFSRKILAWEVADRLRGTIRLRTLRHAWQLIRQREPKAQLIVDGGPENHNASVAEFLKHEAKGLECLTAQSDVSFSNSMVEAINRILKSRYIRGKDPPNQAALIKVMQWAVHDYNDVRPHASIQDLTPSEAFAGLRRDRLALTEKIKAARKARIQANRKNRCSNCR